ncbi:hypothetical protein FHR53_001020 [Xanthomonas arboricola]
MKKRFSEEQIIGFLASWLPGFLASCNRAAVVVRENDHRAPTQRGIEDPLATGVKVISVNKT